MKEEVKSGGDNVQDDLWRPYLTSTTPPCIAATPLDGQPDPWRPLARPMATPGDSKRQLVILFRYDSCGNLKNIDQYVKRLGKK